MDFEHLHDLDLHGVQWVTSAKDIIRYCALRNLPVNKGGKVIKEQIVKLTGDKFKHLAGWTLRRVEAWVEVDGERLFAGIEGANLQVYDATSGDATLGNAGRASSDP